MGVKKIVLSWITPIQPIPHHLRLQYVPKVECNYGQISKKKKKKKITVDCLTYCDTRLRALSDEAA